MRMVEDSIKLLADLSENVRDMIPAMEDLESVDSVLEQGIRLSRRCNNLANYLELIVFNNQLITIANATLGHQKDLISRLYRNVQACLETDNPTVRL